MTTDELLKEISEKLDYQTKLLEEFTLARGENLRNAEDGFKDTINSLLEMFANNPDLEASPLINILRSTLTNLPFGGK